MKNFVVVRFTNRVDGTTGNSVKPYEDEGEALKEFFRQAGQAVDSTHLTDSVSLLSKEGFELRHEYFEHDGLTNAEPVEENAE